MYKSIFLYMCVESKISNLTGFDLESDMAAATQFTHAKALQNSTSPREQVRPLEMEAHSVKKLGKNCWKMLENLGSLSFSWWNMWIVFVKSKVCKQDCIFNLNLSHAMELLIFKSLYLINYM